MASRGQYIHSIDFKALFLHHNILQDLRMPLNLTVIIILYIITVIDYPLACT